MSGGWNTIESDAVGLMHERLGAPRAKSRNVGCFHLLG